MTERHKDKKINNSGVSLLEFIGTLTVLLPIALLGFYVTTLTHSRYFLRDTINSEFALAGAPAAKEINLHKSTAIANRNVFDMYLNKGEKLKKRICLTIPDDSKCTSSVMVKISGSRGEVTLGNRLLDILPAKPILKDEVVVKASIVREVLSPLSKFGIVGPGGIVSVKETYQDRGEVVWRR